MSFRVTALFLSLWLAPSGARAATYLSQTEALSLAFPKGATVEREPIFLSPEQTSVVAKVSGAEKVGGLVVRYVGRVNGEVAGYAYFDTHRVRTLPETLMIVITPQGRVSRVEVLSFDEPQDYLPRRAWLDQMHGRKLDGELSLRKAIRPITGASLSGRAVVDSVRKMLAVHDLLLRRPASAAASRAR